MWAYNRRPAKSTLFIVPLKRKRKLKSTEPGSEFQSFNNNNKAREKEKAYSLAKNDERFNRCNYDVYILFIFVSPSTRAPAAVNKLSSGRRTMPKQELC